MTERTLARTGDNTVYTMWNGEGILGPRTGKRLRTYPALWGRITLEAFRERYGHLGKHCKLMTDEVTGLRCDELCALVDERACSAGALQTVDSCLQTCSWLPRSTTECMLNDEVCDPEECLFVDHTPPT